MGVWIVSPQACSSSIARRLSRVGFIVREHATVESRSTGSRSCAVDTPSICPALGLGWGGMVVVKYAIDETRRTINAADPATPTERSLLLPAIPAVGYLDASYQGLPIRDPWVVGGIKGDANPVTGKHTAFTINHALLWIVALGSQD